jgi:hypothetical protein
MVDEASCAVEAHSIPEGHMYAESLALSLIAFARMFGAALG